MQSSFKTFITNKCMRDIDAKELGKKLLINLEVRVLEVWYLVSDGRTHRGCSEWFKLSDIIFLCRWSAWTESQSISHEDPFSFWWCPKNTIKNSNLWVLLWLVRAHSIGSYFISHEGSFLYYLFIFPIVWYYYTWASAISWQTCWSVTLQADVSHRSLVKRSNTTFPLSAIENLLLVLNVASTYDWSDLNFIFYRSVAPSQDQLVGLVYS